LLSNPRFHQKNFDFISETFLRNSYPLEFIFDTISNRLKNLINKKTKKQNLNNITDDDHKGWFLIPFSLLFPNGRISLKKSRII